MIATIIQLSKVGKIEKQKCKSPNSHKYKEVRIREYLLPSEVERILSVTKKSRSRHAHRNYTIILLIYRHGLRLSEAAALRWTQIDFKGGTIYVKRVKNGTPSIQPLYADEIRALRKLQRDYLTNPYVFQSNRHAPLTEGASTTIASDTISGIIEQAGKLAKLPFPIHMLRHSTGYYLANRGIDTRTIQSYLGHRNIQHTVRYTDLSSSRFQGLWDS